MGRNPRKPKSAKWIDALQLAIRFLFEKTHRIYIFFVSRNDSFAFKRVFYLAFILYRLRPISLGSIAYRDTQHKIFFAQAVILFTYGEICAGGAVVIAVGILAIESGGP